MSFKSKCRKRCDSWFSLQPSIRDGCRKLCNTGRTEFTYEEYLCGGEGPPDVDIIRVYGYDPCLGTGATIEGYSDPLNERARQDARETANQEIFKDVLIVAAGLIALALLGFFFMRSK